MKVEVGLIGDLSKFTASGPGCGALYVGLQSDELAGKRGNRFAWGLAVKNVLPFGITIRDFICIIDLSRRFGTALASTGTDVAGLAGVLWG